MSQRLHFAAAAFLAVALASPAWANGAQPDGAQIYKRCAACHTATGAGVPGAYPPLQADFRALAVQKDGRRYLSLAVIKGLMGPITVEGKSYRGMMPAQSDLSDAAIAAVLNHIATNIAKADATFKNFTAAEVASARASGKDLTAADVARLHPGEPQK